MTLVGDFTAHQLCLAVGYIFPIYKSSRALRRQDKHELLQWVTFWTVNALFWAVELVGDTVIGWVPFYVEAKIALLLWLVLPQYCGARVLHEKWLAPTFEKHEEVIDVAITDIKRRASEKVVQVCKDTAALALRRGSGVVAQGQQYVATQLVQQALGKLQQPAATSESQELRVPAILSMLTMAVTAPAAVPASRKSIPPAKEPELKASAKDIFLEKITEETGKKDKAESKQESKSDVSDVKPQDKPLPVPPKRAVSPPTVPTPTALAARNQEKSKELVSHFKKLLVKGFQLKYYPSEGALKKRTLRLMGAQSRYLIFESSTGDASKPKKSVTLFIHNVRRVAACKASDDGMTASLNENLAFALDNGKTSLLFEAENTKTRDLLVAGMRLLVNEHKRQDTIGLTTITNAFDKSMKQRTFDRMMYVLAKTRHDHEADLST